jgi:hypothetical protein
MVEQRLFNRDDIFTTGRHARDKAEIAVYRGQRFCLRVAAHKHNFVIHDGVSVARRYRQNDLDRIRLRIGFGLHDAAIITLRAQHRAQAIDIAGHAAAQGGAARRMLILQRDQL